MKRCTEIDSPNLPIDHNLYRGKTTRSRFGSKEDLMFKALLKNNMFFKTSATICIDENGNTKEPVLHFLGTKIEGLKVTDSINRILYSKQLLSWLTDEEKEALNKLEIYRKDNPHE